MEIIIILVEIIIYNNIVSISKFNCINLYINIIIIYYKSLARCPGGASQQTEEVDFRNRLEHDLQALALGEYENVKIFSKAETPNNSNNIIEPGPCDIDDEAESESNNNINNIPEASAESSQLTLLLNEREPKTCKRNFLLNQSSDSSYYINTKNPSASYSDPRLCTIDVGRIRRLGWQGVNINENNGNAENQMKAKAKFNKPREDGNDNVKANSESEGTKGQASPHRFNPAVLRKHVVSALRQHGIQPQEKNEKNDENVIIDTEDSNLNEEEEDSEIPNNTSLNDLNSLNENLDNFNVNLTSKFDCDVAELTKFVQAESERMKHLATSPKRLSPKRNNNIIKDKVLNQNVKGLNNYCQINATPNRKIRPKKLPCYQGAESSRNNNNNKGSASGVSGESGDVRQKKSEMEKDETHHHISANSHIFENHNIDKRAMKMAQESLLCNEQQNLVLISSKPVSRAGSAQNSVAASPVDSISNLNLIYIVFRIRGLTINTILKVIHIAVSSSI